MASKLGAEVIDLTGDEDDSSSTRPLPPRNRLTADQQTQLIRWYAELQQSNPQALKNVLRQVSSFQRVRHEFKGMGLSSLPENVQYDIWQGLKWYRTRIGLPIRTASAVPTHSSSPRLQPSVNLARNIPPQTLPSPATASPRASTSLPLPNQTELERVIRAADPARLKGLMIELCRMSPALSRAAMRCLAPQSDFATSTLRPQLQSQAARATPIKREPTNQYLISDDDKDLDANPNFFYRASTATRHPAVKTEPTHSGLSQAPSGGDSTMERQRYQDASTSSSE